MLTATRTLVASSGYAQLTVDAVAAAAGVGKPAIYRRYPSKAALVFAAVVHTREVPEPADTGSLRGDLRAMVRDVYEILASGPTREIAPAILAEIGTDPVLAERFRESVLEPEREYVAIILDRAVARGELRERPDPTGVNFLLTGPLFYATIGFLLDLDQDRLDLIADTVASGLTA